MNYRADIDALRTFAVLAVVIFHFNGSALPGGFAGVDVFFAISGYLMTGIISSGIVNERFLVSRFYLSRAKRIIPALSVLCLSLMVFGWFKLAPLEYSALSKHAISSILFVSNFVYWNESGYFDAASHEKWLLHTWSLSAEWQFYLIYPFILLALYRVFRGKWIGASLIALAISSYLYSVYSSYVWPTSSYFLLPSRAWEMFAGGIAYFYARKPNKKWSGPLHYFGLSLIVISYFVVSSQDLWPGYMAMLPVFGSCLYLYSNYKGFFSEFKPAVLVGKWSYSIYLWHWPVVVYCYMNDVDVGVLSGVFISIVLGFVSYQIIEKRRSSRLLAVTPFAAAASFFVLIGNGFAYQMPKDVYNATMLDPNSEVYGVYTWKAIKKLNLNFSGEERKVLVIGDSTAGDFVNVMLEAGIHERMQIRTRIVTSNCGSFFLNQAQRDSLYSHSYDIKNGLVTREQCDRDIGHVFNDESVKQADVIVVSMNWRTYAIPELSQSLRNLRSITTAPIFVVGSKSFDKPLPRIIYDAHIKGSSISHYAYSESLNQISINREIRRVVEDFDGVEFIDIKKTMCDSNNQSCTVVSNNSPLLYDSTHSTLQGVLYISKSLSNELLKIK